MDFNELVEKAKNKDIGQNSVSDYVLFEMKDKDGKNRKVMKSEIDLYFSKRGRKTEEDKMIYEGYQDYLVSQVNFEIADQKTNNLGHVKYKTGETLPVVVRIDDYDFTESAISYYQTFKTRSPQQEVAVMVGKALDLIQLEDDETIDSIKKRLGID